MRAGRGAGKTRSSSEWMANECIKYPGLYAVVGMNDQEVHGTNLFGEDGIQHCLEKRGYTCRPDMRANIIRVPEIRSEIRGFTGLKPNNLRGKNLSGILMDELAFHLEANEVWKQARLAVRKNRMKKVITTTPSKKAVQLMRAIESRDGTVVTRANSMVNLANLSQGYKELIDELKGTRDYRIEIEAELIDDAGLLFNQNMFQYTDHYIDPQSLDRVVVGLDPSLSGTADAGESGIVVAGTKTINSDTGGPQKVGYVLADRSKKGGPMEIIKACIQAYNDFEADCIAIETNNGGDWLPTSFKQADPTVRIKTVTATRGKAIRAQPIVHLYEKGLIYHTQHFTKLEQQMVDFDPDEAVRNRKWSSPDKMDALVWALTYLFERSSKPRIEVVRQPFGLSGF